MEGVLRKCFLPAPLYIKFLLEQVIPLADEDGIFFLAKRLGTPPRRPQESAEPGSSKPTISSSLNAFVVVASPGRSR